MKAINTNEINVNNILVAAYNAAPFNVADQNAYKSIAEILAGADQGLVKVYTAEDEEFESLAQILDYTTEIPEAIYVVNGNELTFAMEK